MGRAASPALSETEVDISRSLFGNGVADSDVEGEEEHYERLNAGQGIIDEDDDADRDEAFIAATQVAVNRKHDSKTSKKAGAFQTMGLSAILLKAITRKGFTVPTPIQRKTIPPILDGQDVVGMARTGSGKTAAFVIPMIEKLKAHSAKVGARAMILSPSRELALQTLKVVKELGKGRDLRTTLLVGGDSLEDQFSSMAANPDIIIATPGRFEHLKVEMGLELSSVKYVVFDEADRLFEMGFAAQLTEIMHSLPVTRQTLLFSATLPKSLVEFARAGLQDPRLVRLDAESKMAPGLDSAFFNVKRAEKEGALLHILQDVIKMPLGLTAAALRAQKRAADNKKRKRGADGPAPRETPSLHSTVVFAATKHHVEYLAALLKHFGYATSYVYGSLDQTARKMQTEDFRTGMTNILVVTDVAARGLDIPVLANVINYDFPSQPKIFVHRVGRTARAGKAGWAHSLVTVQDMSYLLDLQLFLGRNLVLGRTQREPDLYKNNIILGAMLRDKLERNCEEVTKLMGDDGDLAAMRDVAAKGEKQYIRTRNSASAESIKRARKLADDESLKGTNMLFEYGGEDGAAEQQRLEMLAKVSGFRPQETVFEIGRKGATNNEMADVVRKRRQQIEMKQRKKAAEQEAGNKLDGTTNAGDTNMDDAALDDESDDELVLTAPNEIDMEEALDSDLESAFPAQSRSSRTGKRHGDDSWQDSEHFMSYTPASLNLAEDRGYSISHNDPSANSNSHFLDAARGATMDLAGDESAAFKEASKPGLRWDKRHKKFVNRANDEDGSRGNTKFVRSESGQKIPTSFRSGRFDAWKKANKVSHLPRVGEAERASAHFASSGPGRGGMQRRFKHKQERAPKEADKYRDDYYKKRKQVAAAKEKGVGRFAEQGKSELRGVDDVRKERKLQQKRTEKNARPSRKKM